MSVGYCPNCRSNVFTTRKDINIGICILLIIFTCGIGLLLYLIYYYMQEPISCVHCKSICRPQVSHVQAVPRVQVSAPNQQQVTHFSEIKKDEPVQINKTNFCHKCGVRLGDREDIKFCALCGANI